MMMMMMMMMGLFIEDYLLKTEKKRKRNKTSVRTYVTPRAKDLQASSNMSQVKYGF